MKLPLTVATAMLAASKKATAAKAPVVRRSFARRRRDPPYVLFRGPAAVHRTPRCSRTSSDAPSVARNDCRA